jgi:hypothetical protein
MKKLIIILLFSVGLQAQNKIDEIIFTQPIKGLIEIDGHIFKGDTVKNKVRYELTPSCFTILDNKNKYQIRKCSKEKCNIIHLEPNPMNSLSGIRFTPTLGQLYPTYNNTK